MTEKGLSSMFAGIKTKDNKEKTTIKVPAIKKEKETKESAPIRCGNCLTLQVDDESIKEQTVTHANGDVITDYLCDECYTVFEEDKTKTEQEEAKKQIAPKIEGNPSETTVPPAIKPPAIKPPAIKPPPITPVVSKTKKKRVIPLGIKKPLKKVTKPVAAITVPITKSKVETGSSATTEVESVQEIIEATTENVPLVKGLITSEAQLKELTSRDVIHFEDGEEIEDLEGIVLTIMGLKGDGKTALALSAERGMFDPELAPDPSKCDHPEGKECEHCRPTIIFAISMDGQTNRIAKQYRAHGKRVHVYNGLKYYSEKSDEVRLMTSTITCHFINDILTRQIPQRCKALYGIDRPDFIVIDDMEELAKLAEGKMRDEKGFTIYENFDWQYWTKRNMILDEIHRRAGEMSIEAIIYTTYQKWEEVTEGDTQEKRKLPKWVASIKKKTNTTIETRGITQGDTRSFQALVLNAKDLGWTYIRRQVTTNFAGKGGLWNLKDPRNDEKFYEPPRE